MAHLVDPGIDPSARPSDGFDIFTRRCDATRAELHVAGDLDDAAADILRQVLDGHLRARRRYLRLDVGGVRRITDTVLTVIATSHEALMARGGTLILMAVRPAFEARLRSAVPASPLLILPASAAEHGGFGLA